MVTKIALKYLPLLKKVARLKPAERQRVLNTAPPDFIRAISEGSLNILKGNVPLSKSRHRYLKRHRKSLKTLANKRASLKGKKQVLQRGGFIGALAGVLVPLITSLIASRT